MTLSVEIRVEAPQALPMIAAVEAGLTKVEAAGPRVGDALSRGFGDSSTAAEKAKQSTQSLTEQMAKLANSGSSFAGLSDHFKRTADQLEAIRGPMREYMANTAALKDLFDRGTISANEYDKQLVTLYSQMGKKPTAPTEPGGGGEEGGVRIEGSIGSAVAGQFGELGTALDGLASKGALEAAAMVGLGVEAVHLGDEYINLRNNALRLSESYDQVDSTLNQQLALSKDLHASLEQTMELSTIVKERTEDMGISQGTATRYAKELGEAVELSGHPMGDATSAISRLTFALESGMPAGREMKNIMREFPEIADAIKTHLHATSAEIVDMANKGRFSFQTFFDSLDEGGASMATKLGQRTEATSMQWQHFKDTLVLSAGKLVENSGAIAALGGALKIVGDIVQLFIGGLTLLHDALGDIGTVAAIAGTALAVTGSAIAASIAPFAAAAAAFELAKYGGTKLAEWWDKDKIAATEALKAEDELLEVFNKKMKLVNEQYDAIIRDYEAHNELFDAINKVASALAGGEKIWDDNNAKVTAAAKKVDDYAAALHKVQAEQAQLKAAGMKDPTLALTAGQVEIVRGSVDAQRDLNDMLGRYGEVVNKIHKSEDDRRRGVEDLNGALHTGKITQTEYAEAIKQYQGQLSLEAQILQEINGPQKKFEQQLAALNDLQDRGLISFRQYGAAVAKFIDALPKPDDNPASVIDEINNSLQRSADLMIRVGSLRSKLDLTKDDNGNTIDNSTRNAASMTMASLGQVADVGSVPTVADVSKSAQANTSGFQSTLDKYDAEIAKLNSQKDILGPDNLAKSIKNLNEQFGAAVSPAEKLARETDEVNGLLARHAITIDDATKKLEQLAKEQEKIADSGHDFASGLSRGWHSIRDEASDTAADISSTMKAAFDGVNGAIVSMVTTGQADWGKLASTIEADFAKMALHKVESSIFDAVGGGATAASTGVATGSAAIATMTASAGVVGAAIGAAAAGAMAAGSAASSGAEAAVAGIAGSWAGSDTMIPHAANGYVGKVGGVAGTDTRLFAAMVTPGETVQIRTPEQMAAQGQGGGGRGPTIINQFQNRGELVAMHADGSLDTPIINVIKRNIGAVQSLLKK